MFSKLFSLVLSILFCSCPGFAFFNMADYYNESIFQNTTKKKTWKISTAYGIGSQNSSLKINNEHTLYTTNRNFLILAANLDSRSNIQFFIPFKDPKPARDSRVDSDSQFISLNTKLTESIFASLDFAKQKGFYFEEGQPSFSKNIYALPNLGFEKITLSFYYLTNTKHQSLFIEPLVLKRGEDSLSWLFFAGYNHAKISGLNDTNSLPKSGQFNHNTKANYANINSLDSRVAYGGNWFWSNWYIAGSVGIGLNYNFMNIQNLNGTDTQDSKGYTNSLLSFSNGYFWTNSSLSWFVTSLTSTYQIEDLNLFANTGKVGLYFAYQF